MEYPKLRSILEEINERRRGTDLEVFIDNLYSIGEEWAETKLGDDEINTDPRDDDDFDLFVKESLKYDVTDEEFNSVIFDRDGWKKVAEGAEDFLARNEYKINKRKHTAILIEN